MKTLIVYHSQTGFTKRYAEWLAEDLAGAQASKNAGASDTTTPPGNTAAAAESAASSSTTAAAEPATETASPLSCTLIPYAKRNTVNMDDFDTVVFCSWLHAGGIKAVKWFKEQMANHPKVPGDYLVLVVGATPMPNEEWPLEDLQTAFHNAFPEDEYPQLPWFYCQGGFAYDRLSAGDKLMMKMFFRIQEKAAETDPKAAIMLEGMKQEGGFDDTNRDYLAPLLACLRNKAKAFS